MILINPYYLGSTSKAAYSDNFDSYANLSSIDGNGSWINGIDLSMAVRTSHTSGMDVSPYLSGALSGSIYNATFANDQYSQITRSYISGGGMGAGVRLSGTTAATFCGYGLMVMDDHNESAYCAIYKITNGVLTALGSTYTFTPTAGDTFKLTVSGSTLTAYRNGSVWTSVGTNGVATDSTYTSGKAGIIGFGSWQDTRADNWLGGDL